MLTTGDPLNVQPLSNDRWRISGLPKTPPAPLAPVLKLEFSATPYQLAYAGDEWMDGAMKTEKA